MVRSPNLMTRVSNRSIIVWWEKINIVYKIYSYFILMKTREFVPRQRDLYFVSRRSK